MTTVLNLPDLSRLYDAPAERIAEFQEKGHTVLRGVASPEEIAAYKPEIESAVEADSRETRPIDERDTYGKAFLQVPNLWRRHEGPRRFVLSSRFAKIAADLLGASGVRLYHDQALFKEGGGGQTPWHQDQYYWPLSSDQTITMWMPLIDIPPEIGSMTFASGSQKLGYLGATRSPMSRTGTSRRWSRRRGSRWTRTGHSRQATRRFTRAGSCTARRPTRRGRCAP